MTDYIELTKAMQSVIPKIDYRGLTEAFSTLNSASDKFQQNLAESVEGIRSQLEMVSSKVQAQIKDMPTFDTSVVKALQKQLDSFQKMDRSVYDAISKIDTEGIMKALKVSNPLANYDYDMMAKALQNSFIRTKEKQEEIKENQAEAVLESIVKDVQEEYNKAEEVIDKDLVNSKEIKEKKKVTTEDVWKIIERIGIIIAIIVGLRDIFGGTETKIYNSVQEANNYYINELKIDADYWNMFQYRIINQRNVMPRTKPDRTSRVTDHLSEGCVVQKLKKYRKWVQIYWIDENGNDCCGWIQNYKLDEFKNN